jgi:hypothetical protein
MDTRLILAALDLFYRQGHQLGISTAFPVVSMGRTQ